jgi:hypothetical protein
MNFVVKQCKPQTIVFAPAASKTCRCTSGVLFHSMAPSAAPSEFSLERFQNALWMRLYLIQNIP